MRAFGGGEGGGAERDAPGSLPSDLLPVSTRLLYHADGKPFLAEDHKDSMLPVYTGDIGRPIERDHLSAISSRSTVDRKPQN